MFEHIEWHTYEPPARAGDVASVERILGVRFPASFVECVLLHNGGQPTPSGFEYIEPTHGTPIGHGVGRLLSFLPVADGDGAAAPVTEAAGTEPAVPEIVRFHRKPPVDFTPGLVAFSECGNGDHVCFDYRADPASSDPPVVIWQHEFIDDIPVAFVAGNFAALLAMLKDAEPPPATADA